MFPTELEDWIFYGVVTIGLGILGTALWEILIKPFSVSIGRKLLKIGTLGIKSTSNRIYQNIAGRAIHRGVVFILGLIGMAIFAQALDYTFKYSKIEKKIQAEYKTGPWSPDRIRADIEREMTASKKTEDEYSLELTSQKEMAVASAIKSIEQKHIVKIVGLTVVALMTFFAYLRQTYVMGAVEYFDQSLAICEPYIDDQEVKEYRAMFANIMSSEDFVQLIKSLQEIAKANDTQIPKFIRM